MLKPAKKKSCDSPEAVILVLRPGSTRMILPGKVIVTNHRTGKVSEFPRERSWFRAATLGRAA